MSKRGTSERLKSARRPVVVAAATVMRLQTIVSRELAAVVTIDSLQAGTKENVIPEKAVIKGRAGCPQ